MELKHMLLARLHAQLGPLGFERRDQEFRRQTPWGWQSIQVIFLDRYGEAYDVGMGFSIRHDQLEDLVFEPHPLIPESEKGESACIGVELGNYLRGFPLDWRLADEQFLGWVTASILKAIDQVVIPYFERFPSLEAILELLSRDDREADQNTGGPEKRAKLALAGAYLLRRRDLFDQWLQAKTELLEAKRMRATARKVREFAGKLRSQWPSDP